MTCTFQGCTNNKFAPHKECALHCVKSNYQDDKLKSVLSEFYSLLKIYIADFMNSAPVSVPLTTSGSLIPSAKLYQANLGVDISQILRNNDLDDKTRDLIKRTNTHDLMVFSSIYFPTRDSRDRFDYFRLLELFSGVHLLDCHVYIGDWRLKDISFFFQDCIFYNLFDITPIRMLSNDTNCLFSECEFKNKVRLSATELYGIFEDSLFSGCVFKNLLRLENTVFKKEPFLDADKRELRLSTLEIYNCNFDGGLKLNKMRISYLWIENTSFLIGFWMLKANISTLNCINVTVDGLFDASDSSFIRAKFNRTKFLDVADFEEVRFGEINGKYLKSDEYVTIFKYVTFMTASNFKNTNFFYSLDFENVDLREQPNFLKSYVNSYNTNRETFRIIKHSFDSKGNNLEGNRFFVEEMKAYKRELNNEGSKWDKLIFFANDIISDFGRSYTRPIAWLVASLILYTILLNAHASYFKNYQYFLHPYFDAFSVYANSAASNFLPFSRFLESKSGFELISLFFYIWFGILIWQIVVAVKRHTQR